MRAVVLILAVLSAPAWAANNLDLLVSATQAYATCIATEASKVPVDKSLGTTERVRTAVDGCATLRQGVAAALDPRGSAEFFARIDRDIQGVALELAEKAQASTK